MFFGRKKLIGLDIGTSSIKIAELDISGRSAALVNFGLIATPASSTSGGDIVEPQAISSAIGQLIGRMGVKRELASTGLWGSSVIVKKITIPRVDEDLVAEQIKWEAEQYIPFDINQVNLDFKILHGNESRETMDLLLIAAIQDVVIKTVEIVESAGLHCSVLDVDGFALANCFEMNYGRVNKPAIAILNIGASVTNFVVLEAGDVIFCRDIPVGGLTYTLEIQRALNLSLEEAEAMKLSFATGQHFPPEIPQIVEATHGTVGDEIGGCMDFYLNTAGNAEPPRVFVTGGGSRTPGLLEKISNKMRVDPFDPLRGLELKGRKFSSDYLNQVRDLAAVAIGLGLRAPGDK